MVIFLLILPFLDPKCSMASSMLTASITFPDTTCFLSSYSVLTVQIKTNKQTNKQKPWEPFVSGPAFAMDKIPGPVYFRIKFSSSNFSL